MTKITFFQNSKSIQKELKPISKINHEKTETTNKNNKFDKIWEQALQIRQQKKKELNQRLENQTNNKQNKKINLLSQKYQPEHYYDLIGDEKNNKSIVNWFNQWRNKNSKIEKQILKPALFWGLPGTGKSTMAKVLAKIYNYQLFVINASAERNGKKLLKKVLDICNTQTINKNWNQNSKDDNKVLLVLEEVDGVINSEKNSAIKFLLENIIDQKTKKMLVNNPIIFICNNMYIKGLKSLREISTIFFFEREKENLIERIIEVIEKENQFIDRYLVEEIAENFNYDIRSIFNYLQLLFLKENFDKIQIRKELENLKDQDQNYFGALNQIFFQKDKKLNFYQYEENYFDGIFENYLKLEKSNDLESAEQLMSVMANCNRILQCINGPNQSYQLTKQAYMFIPFVHNLFSQKQKFKIEFINNYINFKQKRFLKQNIYDLIFKNFNIYYNRQRYLDLFCKMLNIDYSSLSFNNQQKKSFATVLMLLVKMGVQIKENQNYLLENFQYQQQNKEEDDQQNQQFINKQQTYYQLEPNILQFLDYSNNKCKIQLKRQTLAMLKSKYEKIKQLMQINPLVQPGFIQFENNAKKNQFSFMKNQPQEIQQEFKVQYKYKANDVSGVYYQLKFDFFS